jgi:hypothetical protein
VKTANVLLEFLLTEGRRLYYAIPRVDGFAGVRLDLELREADYLGLPMYGPTRMKMGYRLYCSARPRPCGAVEPIEVSALTMTRAISVNVELTGLAEAFLSESWAARSHTIGGKVDEATSTADGPRPGRPGS